MRHLSHTHLLEKLPEDQVTLLRRFGSPFTFEAGATIFSPSPKPEFVFILESGLARIYRVGHGGNELTLGYIHPGEVFGELTAFDDEAPRESYAEATEACRVLRVTRGEFIKVLRSQPSMIFAVAAQVEGRFKRIEARVEDLVFRSARSRLARILIQLADDFGRELEASGAILIDARLTHADLATLVGSTRPTVSIALGELEDAGVVARNRGTFTILKPDALRAVADQQG